MRGPDPRVALPAVFAAVAFFVASASLAYSLGRRTRPLSPDALTPALEAERRVLYLVNEVGAELGDPRVCVCEPASVGTAPAVRRAGR